MISVAIFAKTILPLSQTFIRDHILNIENYRVNVLTGKIVNSERISPAVAIKIGEGATRLWASALTGKVTPNARQILERSALVHAHFLTDAAFIYAAVRRNNLPLVVTAHGFDATAYRWARLRERTGVISEIRRRAIIDYATAVICPSEYIASRLIEESGVPQEKIQVIHNGVAERFFLAAPQLTTSNCLFVGRLVEKKGCIHLLRAWPLVRRKSPNAVLHIVGEGPDQARLKALAASEGSAVVFHGAQPHSVVEELIKKTRVVVVPSSRARTGDNEGLPMICLEAMASAKPLVCFRQGPLLETLDEGVSGLFADERNPTDLAEKISFFLCDQEASIAYGRHAREKALDRFTLKGQIRNIEALYKRVIEAGK